MSSHVLTGDFTVISPVGLFTGEVTSFTLSIPGRVVLNSTGLSHSSPLTVKSTTEELSNNLRRNLQQVWAQSGPLRIAWHRLPDCCQTAAAAAAGAAAGAEAQMAGWPAVGTQQLCKHASGGAHGLAASGC